MYFLPLHCPITVCFLPLCECFRSLFTVPGIHNTIYYNTLPLIHHPKQPKQPKVILCCGFFHVVGNKSWRLQFTSARKLILGCLPTSTGIFQKEPQVSAWIPSGPQEVSTGVYQLLLKRSEAGLEILNASLISPNLTQMPLGFHGQNMAIYAQLSTQGTRSLWLSSSNEKKGVSLLPPLDTVCHVIDDSMKLWLMFMNWRPSGHSWRREPAAPTASLPRWCFV